ncbi:hypothetical protein OG943_09595 [Amycolatopsis sp. NBC_00345]|uniref:hypothetical protein n=1 Tax=Amycolatopsis sp. NBC_00345 TaxID=2975955 RepID=UPI002E258ECA
MAASSKELKSQVIAYLVEQLKSGSSIKAESENAEPSAGKQRSAPSGGLAWLQAESPMMWKVVTLCQSEEGVRQFVLEVLGPDLEEIKKEIEELRSGLPPEKGGEPSDSRDEGVRV